MALNIEKIGVIGAGQMGAGIAHVCALSNRSVQLLDINQDQLDKAVADIETNLSKQVRKELISEGQAKEALALIETGTDYQFFEQTDMVIEAATEKEDLKAKIFDQLCPCLKQDAIVASNTSSISITQTWCGH